MILSLPLNDLKAYVAAQLNHFFPDKNVIKPSDLNEVLDVAIDRVNYCFSKVAYERYNKNGQTILNHLYADQYLVFIWFLSNTVWKNNNNNTLLATKLYYLNKSLHAFDCMYDTGLPDIFLIFHGAGTMLGKASYADYFVALQGCTIGSHKGKYPVMGQGVALAAHASIIGNCNIGDRVTLSANASVYERNISSDILVFRDAIAGSLCLKETKNSYSQSFFNVDLSTISK